MMVIGLRRISLRVGDADLGLTLPLALRMLSIEKLSTNVVASFCMHSGSTNNWQMALNWCSVSSGTALSGVG
jgi:hypothetical protein